MHITYTAATTAAPNSANEDHLAVGDGWALVLDGAGRYPGETGGCIHPITWVVARLGIHLSSCLSQQPEQPLTTIARSAVEATMADHDATCDLSDPLSPGATGAIVRVRKDRIDWLVVGDCAVVIDRGQDGYTTVIDDRVDHLPDAPIVEGRVRTYSPAYVATVRNRPGGFWVLGAVPAAAEHALVGTLPRPAATQVLLCSDGISRLTERYGWGWQDVMALHQSAGPESLIRAVRESEHNDPDPQRWRGKRHDDATVVVIQVTDA
ncbi:protein phosphatase 2C domain-containing protein [Micromonospora peucetia]|uniref:Protein phosphatase 2C n=1 Tax=Micromonospora peucetia TaxID=47871 RepID=A0A1C6TUS6_9ACTN|nr:protein phosphatase 2C domain-containing protein [Micromonospora peucetia]SCL45535.1 Protein phosphatase 2C [Micromonospora peucetia]